MTGNGLKIAGLASLIALGAIIGAAQDRPDGLWGQMVHAPSSVQGEAI